MVVEASLYCGNNKLNYEETVSVPLVLDIKPFLNETKVYELVIPNEKIVFDFAGFNQEIYGTSDVFTVIAVKYKTPSNKSFHRIIKTKYSLLFFLIEFSNFYLGYCKLVLCSTQKIGNVFTWDIAHGPIKKFLHPGIVSENFDSITDTPVSSYKGLEN